MNIEVKNGVYTFKGTDIAFSFYTNLSAVNKIKFVNTVTDYIVDKNYNSIIRDLMFDFEIVDIFTDIDLTEIREAVDSLSKIEEFLYETKVVDIVKENMIDGLLHELNKSVDDNISYRTGIYRNNFLDALSNLLITLDEKFNEIAVPNLAEMTQKLSNISHNLSAKEVAKAYAKINKSKFQK